MIWLGIIILVIMFIGIATAADKIKISEHTDISWAYISFGMYTWFQVLALSPFWLLFAVASMFWWQPTTALRAYIIFHSIRSMTEIISAQSNNPPEYINPILAPIKQISPTLPNQMYTLLHMSILVICLYLLLGFIF